MMKPAASSSGEKKYPVLMFVYGDPAQIQLATHGTGIPVVPDALPEGYIVVSVDNRGTVVVGKIQRLYLQAAWKFETEDQIEAAKYLGTLPYVDKTALAFGDGVMEVI